MTLLSSSWSCLIVFVLKWRFSRLKKYLVFFSPSLCQRAFDLMIVPRVWYWQIFSNWSVLTSNSLSVSVLSVSERLFSYSFFWRDKISHSKFVSFDFILAFFSFAYLSELERIRLFMVSQRSTGSTSLLLILLSSIATSAIVFLITFTYSLSDKNEVFSFQKPGPLKYA